MTASSQKLTGVKSGLRILSMAKRSERELSPSEPTTMRCPQCDADRPVREQRMGANYRLLGYCGHVVTLVRGSRASSAVDVGRSPATQGLPQDRRG